MYVYIYIYVYIMYIYIYIYIYKLYEYKYIHVNVSKIYKWCFINKVREEHDQIINRFGTGATRLANHPNEHNAYMYK